MNHNYYIESFNYLSFVGLIANLTQEISWFKYVGNVTLDCAAKAHEMSTLMEAVETLHDCLEAAYQVIIIIRIIYFGYIYIYGTISGTIIYINKHDSRINPGNRYKVICQATSVTVGLPGQ